MDGPPSLRDLSGVWMLLDKASDPLEPLFRAMGVTWMDRKLVNGTYIPRR